MEENLMNHSAKIRLNEKFQPGNTGKNKISEFDISLYGKTNTEQQIFNNMNVEDIKSFCDSYASNSYPAYKEKNPI